MTDPARATVLLQVAFEPLQPGAYHLYALYDPALGAPLARTRGPGRGAAPTWRCLPATVPLPARSSPRRVPAQSSGYSSVSDGWTDLQKDFNMDWSYETAPSGNVLKPPRSRWPRPASRPSLALGFAESPEEAVRTGARQPRRLHRASRRAYQDGWHTYLASLPAVPAALSDKLATQYSVAVMTIKAHEDKTRIRARSSPR